MFDATPSRQPRPAVAFAFLGTLLWAGAVGAAPVAFTDIADTTTAAPGHGAFTGFGNLPSVSGSNVQFTGAYSGGSGSYTGHVGTTGATRVADGGDNAPGHTAFTGFGDPSISGSNVAFLGFYNNGVNSGIYTGTVGATGAAKVVETGDTAPGRTAFTAFNNPSVGGNAVAFVGSYSGGSGVYTGTAGTAGATKVVDQGSIAPGRTAFNFFGSPAVSGNVVSFNGNYSGGGGIYTGTVGAAGATRVVDTGDTAPGHGPFTNFSTVTSVSGNNVAFRGSFSGGSGIYTGTVGATGATKVADTSDTAPGHGAFIGFGEPSISGSNVAFVGNYSGGSGIFLESAGGFSTVLNKGDPLFGSTVSGFLLGSFAYDSNTIAFSYTLADGRSGIASAVVPEPSTPALLALSGVVLLRRRRAAGSGLRQRAALISPCSGESDGEGFYGQTGREVRAAERGRRGRLALLA